MALSSIHDVAGHHATPHHPHHPHQHPHQPNAISRIQHVVIDHEKVSLSFYHEKDMLCDILGVLRFYLRH